jgi:hypothetical protein
METRYLHKDRQSIMSLISYLLGSGMFFTPFIYVALYLYIERSLSNHVLIQNTLKTITVMGGLFMIFYACTASLDFKVLMPSGGTAKNEIPAPIFLVILGATLVTLPLYSKYVKFSNKSA